MITRFHVENFKALRDVAVDLTPIHVLIGPNDSGKTSILEALAALCRSVDHPLAEAFLGRWSGMDLVWWMQRDGQVAFRTRFKSRGHELEYRLTCQFAPGGREVAAIHENLLRLPQGEATTELRRLYNHQTSVSGLVNEPASAANQPEAQRIGAAQIHDALSGVHYYRWNTNFLALPVAPDARRRFRMASSGFGLALLLDDILGYDRDRFIEMEGRFKRVFPHVKSIKLIAEPAYRSPTDDPQQIPMLQKADGKGIHFEFETGRLVPAAQVSDGVLLVLAYLAVLYLPEPPRVILVEEPENGIHPGRLADVLKILRDLIAEQEETQILLTTHSPYVVDTFQPEEVTLCHKVEDGAVEVRRLSESERVREQIDLFTLGEIWTGEGDDALAAAPPRSKQGAGAS